MATPAMPTKPRATAPHARMDPRTARRGMFVIEDGRNVAFTFFLLVFLFALWGFCNGMIDVMDKHFQEELHLNLAQSAGGQFAHYLGYFIRASPRASPFSKRSRTRTRPSSVHRSTPPPASISRNRSTVLACSSGLSRAAR